MEAARFKPDTHYTLVCRDQEGRPRPTDVYVFRAHREFLIVRRTGADGMLHKIPYKDVERVVDERPVGAQDRYTLPAAVLDEKTWRGRDSMQHHASSARRGK